MLGRFLPLQQLWRRSWIRHLYLLCPWRQHSTIAPDRGPSRGPRQTTGYSNRARTCSAQSFYRGRSINYHVQPRCLHRTQLSAGPDGLVTLSVPAPASAGTHFANPELGSDGSSNVGSVTTLASSSDYSFSTKPVSRTFQQGNGGRHGPTENLDCQSTTLSTSTEGPSGSAAAQSTACPCTQSAPGAPSFSRPTQTYASQPSAQFSLSTTSPDSGNFPSQTTQLSTRDCDEPSSLFSLTTTTTSPVSTLTQSTTFGTVSSTSRPESTDCSEEMLRLTPTPPMPFSLPTASSVWSTSTIPSVQSLASSGHCSNSSSSYTSTSFTSSTSLSSSSCTDETTTSSSSTQHHSTTTSLVSTDCESAVTSSTQHTQPSHGSASLRQATINTTSTSHTESSRSSSFSSQSVVLTTGPAEYTTAPSTPPAYLPPLNEYSFLSTPPLYGSSISSSSHTTVLNTVPVPPTHFMRHPHAKLPKNMSTDPPRPSLHRRCNYPHMSLLHLPRNVATRALPETRNAPTMTTRLCAPQLQHLRPRPVSFKSPSSHSALAAGWRHRWW